MNNVVYISVGAVNSRTTSSTVMMMLMMTRTPSSSSLSAVTAYTNASSDEPVTASPQGTSLFFNLMTLSKGQPVFVNLQFYSRATATLL